MTVRQFRWRFYDEDIGYTWSDWHTDGSGCPACCCGGPIEGEHQESAVYYDEFNLPVFSGHARCDPHGDPNDRVVLTPLEWRDLPEV